MKFRGEGIPSIRTTSFSQIGLQSDIHSPKYQLGLSAAGINVIFKTPSKIVPLILSKKQKGEGDNFLCFYKYLGMEKSNTQLQQRGR